MKETCFRIGPALWLLTLMHLAAARPAAAQGALLWQQNLDGTAHSNEEALPLAVDQQGDVLAGGRTLNTGSGFDFTVAKFDRDGTLLWQRALSGNTPTSFDQARSVAADNQRNLLAAGFVTNGGSGLDFTVAKFNRNGTLLWRRDLNGTANGSDVARAVGVDSQGNVFTVGQTTNASTGSDFTVVKFDRNGTLLWLRNLSGSAANSADAALSVALDRQGNVLAAGITQNTGTGSDFTVAKIDRNGTLLWRRDLDGSANGDDQALSVAVDNQGNVLAAGQTLNTGSGFDFTVAKFDSSGIRLWRRSLDGTLNGDDDAVAVAVDNQGNAVAAGFTQNIGSGFRDFTVAKFGRNGTLLWQQDLNGTANSTDQASSVAVDDQGNVLAAGQTVNTGTDSDFTVAKFDRNGMLLWQQDLNGTLNGSVDQAHSVAVDPRGNVLAAGQTENTSSLGDFTVAKFER